MRVAVVMVVVLLATAGIACADDTMVGSLASLHGTVEIDALGKGAFIDAVRGDRVYAATVLRTGPGSGATLDLQGSPVQVPPGVTFRVADAMEGQRRIKLLAWVPALIGVFRDAVASFGSSGSEVVLGSKAQDMGGADDVWILAPEDPAELLLAARHDIRRGDYLQALADLDALDAAGADELPQGDVAFLRGSAYFGLGAYAAAGTHLEAAEPLVRGRDDPDDPMLPVLLFELGAARFFLGQDGPAAATLSAFVALEGATAYDPFAYQLLLRALVNRGERSQAQEVLARAAARYAGTRYEAEFRTLPSGP